MLSVDMINVILLSGECSCTECHYDEFHYDECHYAECRYERYNRIGQKKFYNTSPGACTMKNYASLIYGLRSKLVRLFVQARVYLSELKSLAYYEIWHFPINYESVMFYSTGPSRPVFLFKQETYFWVGRPPPRKVRKTLAPLFHLGCKQTVPGDRGRRCKEKRPFWPRICQKTWNKVCTSPCCPPVVLKKGKKEESNAGLFNKSSCLVRASVPREIG